MTAPAAPTDGSASPDGSADGANASATGGYADFNPSMLAGANVANLSRFEHGNPVLPGTYNADIYLNNAWVGRVDVRFVAASAKASATPCVDRKLLEMLGLRPKLSEAVKARLQDPASCVSFGDLITGAAMTFDMSQLRLDATVPQAYMGQMPRGYVSPEYWDAGVPAAFVNYNLNSYHNSSLGQSQTSTYLSLDSGLNIGDWHLRQDSIVTWQSVTGTGTTRRWQDIDAYVQRDLPSMRAMLTLGDSYTDGAVFDSYGIRGVQLGTDDRMLPQSLQGYAPVIHGVATTNAMVTVRQNGLVIYQTTVTPGPFTINDLYPTGYGGALDVTVTEANGSIQTFSVPYASVAQLLRPGITRFDITAGQLRDLSLTHEPGVLQATVQHGFSNLLTGYAGAVASQGYGALLFGSAINTRYGAIAFDATHATAHIPGYPTQSGQSYRLTYSKVIPQTNTTFSIAADRYSTSGFLSLIDAATARDYARQQINPFVYVPPTFDNTNSQGLLSATQQAELSNVAFTDNPVLSGTGLERQRNSFTLTLNQTLGQHGGSLYANAIANDYWNHSGTDTQFQVGYNNTFHQLSYGITATRSRTPQGRFDNEYMLSFSMPLGHSSHAPNLSLYLDHDQVSGTRDQAMLSGSLGVDNQLSYGATASHASTGTGNSGSVNVGYRSPYAVFNASYGNGSGYTQSSVGISGAIVAHPGGVTFGQPISDTVGIVYAPGAEGARLLNSSGARVDHAGYALVPYLMPYQLDTVQLDPKGLPLNVQLDETSAQVAPYAGAIVMLKFKTQSGRMLIVRARQENGEAVPFGAEVFDNAGNSVGVVGQAGQILLRGVGQAGSLTVRWQDSSGASRSCGFPYALPSHAKSEQANLAGISVTCSMAPSATAMEHAP